MRIARILIVLALAVLLSTGTFAADAPAKPEQPASTPDIKVSVKANDTPVTEILNSLTSQSKAKILVEATVKGKATLAVSDVTLESALTAVCKSANLVWRKLYIDPKSELIEKPDRLAATVRLVSGLSFPDMIVAGSSTNRTSVYSQKQIAVAAAQDKMVKDLGLTGVYLVSNDAAMAAKEAAKNTAVAKYNDMAKQQLDIFMKMTPEEREQALEAGLDIADSLGPDYYASLMQTMMHADPQRLERIAARQTEMLFSMTSEQRRAMIKMNMQLMKKITPEQQKLLMEDSMAVMQELQNQGGQPDK